MLRNGSTAFVKPSSVGISATCGAVDINYGSYACIPAYHSETRCHGACPLSIPDRLYSISSGGLAGVLQKNSSQESISINHTGDLMNGSSSPGNNYGTYNRILRDTYGRPSSTFFQGVSLPAGRAGRGAQGHPSATTHHNSSSHEGTPAGQWVTCRRR